MAMKKKAPAKKAAPKKAVPAARKKLTAREVESKRMNDQAASIRGKEQDRNRAVTYRLEDDAYIRNMAPGIYEGGFNSGGLYKKAREEGARIRQKETMLARQAMKKGVTSVGSLYGGHFGEYDVSRARKANRSDKFKAEQAVKNSGGSLTRNARGKTTKRNAK